ncbi:barnase inhibitor [Saccharomonospora piscinae]|uniref:barstar family protein n=1 Tax=Saccharomonospora piscinae TaxID=687388 RepID=UPI00110710C5|nr:barstar family protein [Saccharomonospora piscinae]TLW94763.1 barnase inhibitor [Saccharomonospora piscinae]
MSTHLLDGRKVRTIQEFHREISQLLDFGPYYGHNLGALRDRLSRDVERPVHLRWEHASYSRCLLDDEYFGKIVNILTRAARDDEKYDWSERFTYDLVWLRRSHRIHRA